MWTRTYSILMKGRQYDYFSILITVLEVKFFVSVYRFLFVWLRNDWLVGLSFYYCLVLLIVTNYFNLVAWTELKIVSVV